MTFTVSAWLTLKFKEDKEPTLNMLVAYEGKFRPKDCLWTKTLEAEDWRKACQIGLDLIKAGDPGDPLDSIPVCPPKANTAKIIDKGEPKAKGKAA